jgi:hypothetical protein
LTAPLPALFVCSLLIFAAAGAAPGQSGRKVRKNPSPTPTPAPAEAARPVPPAPKPEKLQLSLFVCTNGRGTMANIPAYLYDSMRDSFTQRIGEASTAAVTGGRDMMDRSEAVKRAKSTKDVYVVWLELELSTFDPASSINNINPDDLFIRFTVFTPETGKVKTSGRAFQGSRRGPIGIGGRTTRRGSSQTEYQLREAARDAANQVLASLAASTRTPQGREP